MDNKFKDNFNYFAAFLAVLIGLGVFRDFAEKNTAIIFGLSFNYLQLTLPFIGMMLLAVYVGALAILSRNIFFKFVPLTKILENISYFLAALGLLYPIIILLTAWLSVVIALILNDSSLQEYLISILTTIQVTLSVLVALRYAKSKQQDKYDVTLRDLRVRVSAEKTAIDTTETSPYEIVMLYHQFESLSKSLLKLKGYGISGSNIYSIGESLVAQKILERKDLKKISKIRSIRNNIVHPDKTIPKKDMLEAKNILEELTIKIKSIILAQDDY